PHTPHTTELHTPSLHDALPIFRSKSIDLPLALSHGTGLPRRHYPRGQPSPRVGAAQLIELRLQWVVADEGDPRSVPTSIELHGEDRKSTRLNSSHDQISYAVFC